MVGTTGVLGTRGLVSTNLPNIRRVEEDPGPGGQGGRSVTRFWAPPTPIYRHPDPCRLRRKLITRVTSHSSL